MKVIANKGLFIFLLGFLFSDCPDLYVDNPLYTEGDDDYEECIPEEFVFYISTLMSGYFFNVVLINDDEISPNDWVGAFNDLDDDGIGDICVGAKRWDVSSCGGSTCELLVRGDDSSELTDGYMSSGEYPYFKIFDISTGKYLQAFPQENHPFGSLSTPMIGYLQACSGGTLDIDNDDICNEFDPCPYDPDNDIDGDGLCGDVDICFGDNSTNDPDSDGVCSDVDDCDHSLDWDYPDIGCLTNEAGEIIDCTQAIADCNALEIDTDGDGSVDGQAIWNILTNTCGDGICDSVDSCVGNSWFNGGCDFLNIESPYHFSLKQNYPNPFNPFTTIEFSIDRNDFISLSIFDITGRKVKELLNEYLIKGSYKINWDGKDDDANNLPSSVYLVFLEGENGVHHKKLTLIK